MSDEIMEEFFDKLDNLAPMFGMSPDECPRLKAFLRVQWMEFKLNRDRIKRLYKLEKMLHPKEMEMIINAEKQKA